MDKHYITADTLLVDSFRLAARVYDSGFRPDFIIGVWRGGTPVGIAVQEFMEFRGVSTDHIAIRTSSYYGIGQQSRSIRVHGLNYLIDNINAENSVLIVDDVFDSGRSIEATLAELEKRSRRNMPATVRIACPWYKPANNKTAITPDYWVHSTDQWLVFPHELCGLSVDEIRTGKPELAAVFSELGID